MGCISFFKDDQTEDTQKIEKVGVLPKFELVTVKVCDILAQRIFFFA